MTNADELQTTIEQVVQQGEGPLALPPGDFITYGLDGMQRFFETFGSYLDILTKSQRSRAILLVRENTRSKEGQSC